MHIVTVGKGGERLKRRVYQKLSSVVLAVFLLVGCTLLDRTQLFVPAAAQLEEGVCLPVLMYHHISESAARLGDYVISPAQFESDLSFLKQAGYQTVSSAQVLAFVKGGKALPEKAVMITFDDAFLSTYVYAYPLLKMYEMCAVIAPVGVYTEQFSDPNEPRHVNYANVGWTELSEMLESGVFELASHTYHLHGDGKNGTRKGAGKMPGEDAQTYQTMLYDDLTHMNDLCAQHLNQTPTLFAYPFGAISKESVPVLKELGFTLLFSCEEKVSTVTKNSELPLILGRFNRAHRYDTRTFFEKMGISMGEL